MVPFLILYKNCTDHPEIWADFEYRWLSVTQCAINESKPSPTCWRKYDAPHIAPGVFRDIYWRKNQSNLCEILVDNSKTVFSGSKNSSPAPLPGSHADLPSSPISLQQPAQIHLWAHRFHSARTVLFGEMIVRGQLVHRVQQPLQWWAWPHLWTFRLRCNLPKLLSFKKHF